jgi:hypothetical protein
VVQDFFAGLDYFKNTMGGLPHGGVLVHGADREFTQGDIRVIGLQALSRALAELDRI